MKEFDKKFSIKMEPVALEGRKFIRACISTSEGEIGDFHQLVFADSFRLAINDLLNNLSRGSLASVNEDAEIDIIFSALYKAVWMGELGEISNLTRKQFSPDEVRSWVAIPTGIEAFDGELAFFVRLGGGEKLIWRSWRSKDTKILPITREQVIEEFSKYLQYI